MKVLNSDFDLWHIEYVPEDGARITVLKYAGYDLLTSKPDDFSPPGRFYGEYETRPVFGYDDCFPTVDSCLYPGGKFICRDHGELCWSEWQTEITEGSLVCSVDCLNLAVNFKRILIFEKNRLVWRFEVTGVLDEAVVFLHVMHALLPVDKIIKIELPGCGTIFDEINSIEAGLKSSSELGEHLLAFQPASYNMLLLRNIKAGSVKLWFIDGLKLEIGFDHKLFPTLGIWWNKRGYPEGGQIRSECAFEPIPGTCSDLSKSVNDGVSLSVESGEKMTWEISWKVN